MQEIYDIFIKLCIETVHTNTSMHYGKELMRIWSVHMKLVRPLWKSVKLRSNAILWVSYKNEEISTLPLQHTLNVSYMYILFHIQSYQLLPLIQFLQECDQSSRRHHNKSRGFLAWLVLILSVLSYTLCTLCFILVTFIALVIFLFHS